MISANAGARIKQIASNFINIDIQGESTIQ